MNDEDELIESPEQEEAVDDDTVIDDLDAKTNKLLDDIVAESTDEIDDEETHDDDSLKLDDEEEKDEKELIKERNRENAERRIRNKKKHEEEQEEEDDEESNLLDDDQLDAHSVEVYEERLRAAEDYISQVRPTFDKIAQSGLTEQELDIGMQFAKRAKTDLVGVAKDILTVLEQRGIQLDQIYNYQPSNQMAVDAEVNRRMQPILAQQEQERAVAQARQTLDNFLGTYPDAEMHLGEIVEVMKRGNFRDPFDAYRRLRRVYQNRGVDWFGREPEPEYEPEPELASRSVRAMSPQPQPKSMHDLVRMTTNNYFDGE